MQTMTPALIDAYHTCELLTVGRDGTPVAWPTVALRRPDGTIMISTSIGLPQKALNIRRDERVALLFSDPTGSDLDAPDQVLVQGTAVCPDEIVTGPGPWADLWLRVRERQPSSNYHKMPGMRRLMDWYYMRLLITVTPSRVVTSPAWRPAPAAAPPVRQQDASAYAQAVRRMPDFGGAVLCGYDDDGRPTMRRVHVSAAGGRFTVGQGLGQGLARGRASLLWHSHDDKLDSLKAFVVTGDLEDGVLTPDRYVSTADRMGPIAMIRMIRELRGTAQRYLDRRGLARPAIRWNEFAELEAGRLAR
ncbi:pyridoxamine 5'-phosphate oxidase family protein [Actinoplanes sp. NPDC051633]|uniref:pyridoxamine 5'-phosphate oxidase family protein n=1 Tax=Actinoplanes sp. NPDC051633 TaxID=3155670 RepID=UPI003433ACC6